MIERIDGKAKAVLFATHIRQHRTKILRRLKDGIEDTYQLYMDKDALDEAMIRKVDTTNYGFSTMSLVQDMYEPEWAFDLTDENDRLELIKYLRVYFDLAFDGTETAEQIYRIAYESENRTFRKEGSLPRKIPGLQKYHRKLMIEEDRT